LGEYRLSLEPYLKGLTFLNKHAIKLSNKDISFYVHYWGATPSHFDNPVHKHSFFEACYVLDGIGSYIDNEIHYSLANNTMFLSRPGIWHQIKSQTGLFLLFVAFEVIESESSEEGVKLFRHLNNTDQIITTAERYSPAALLWQTLIIQAAHISSFQKQVVSSLACALLSSMHQTFTEQEEQLTQHFQPTSSSLLNRAKLYIKDNLSQPLKLKDVAAYLHISDRHLTRLFSNKLGESFSSYIRQMRIQRAAEMLKNSEQPIKLVAEETGFSSVHYFTKVFTSEIGVTPGRYRKYD
jgi:AraC family transcriptional regulator of arabinose operon